MEEGKLIVKAPGIDDVVRFSFSYIENNDKFQETIFELHDLKFCL